MEENLDKNNEGNKEISDNTSKSNSEEIKGPKSEKVINVDINNGDSANKVVIKKEINTSEKPITKPKKELPVEKKPFQEFINIHLIPSLTEEINQRGLEINNINLTNTNRPIAGDKCWVINCEIKDTCNFWLSFEKDDISSLKSISISKLIKNQVLLNLFLLTKKKLP